MSDEIVAKNVCASLGDLVMYGGNMDHSDRKKLIREAADLIERLTAEKVAMEKELINLRKDAKNYWAGAF